MKRGRAAQVPWLPLGLLAVVLAAVWIYFIVGDVKKSPITPFAADGSFATLAGFTILAVALERISEVVLAPWWGKVAPGAPSAPRVGVTEAALLRARAKAHAARVTLSSATTDDQKKAATEASKAADSVWVQAIRARPTLVLPAAALAALLCSALHLYLLHGVAKTVNGVA